MSNELLRVCKKCGGTNYSMKDGRPRACKDCANAHSRERNAKDPTANRERVKAWQLANPEKVKQQSKDWAAKNVEKSNETKRKWAELNPEKVKISAKKHADSQHGIAAKKKWKLENKELMLGYSKKWYLANRYKALAIRKRWRKENQERAKELGRIHFQMNPEMHRLQNHVRRARKASVGGRLSVGLTKKLMILQKGKCACCGKPLENDYHIDHIMPLALGGANTDNNIQLLRSQCNLEKNKKHPVDFMQSRGFLI